MKNLILILTLFFCSFYSNAQSFTLEHDHSTIQVKDIDRSAEFYKDILQLKETPSPWPENKMLSFEES